jgi:hypothetical protein
MMKAALFSIASLIGIVAMSINTHATESAIASAKPAAPLIPERFIPSINDDRNLDFQTVYPEPDAKGIQIMKNSDMVIDSRGNLYVTGPMLINDQGYGHSSLSKITPAGVISIQTLLMSEQLTSMAIDAHDNIYLSIYSGSGLEDSHAGGGYSMIPKFISDLTRPSSFFTVRKLQPDGQLSMFIPKNKSDCFFSFAVDSNGVLYSDSCNSLIKISSRGFTGRKRESLIDFTENANSIEHSAPAMAIDGDNNLIYVEHNVPKGKNGQSKSTGTDDSYDLIKKISSAGGISNIAGTNESVDISDGVAAKGSFKNISSLAIDSKGGIYVLERQKNTIRKISGEVVSTLVIDAGADVISISIHGNNLYILRKSGIDIVRNLSL